MRKNYVFLFVLCFLLLALRFVYVPAHSQWIINADSYGYLSVAKEIVTNPSPGVFINQYRVPLYPSMLGLLISMNRIQNFSFDAQVFRPVLDQLVLLQAVGGVIGGVVVYVMLLQLSIPVVWACIAGLFISANIYAVSLEHAVMTDSFASTFLIGLTYCLVRLAQRPTKRNYAFFSVVSVFGWLLRPNIVLVPLVTLPALLFLKAHKRFVQTNIQVFCISLLLPILFVLLNAYYHGYAGISQVQEINMLGRILEFRLPVEAGRSYAVFYPAVKDFLQRGGDPMPYRFIDTYAPLTYVDTKLMMELQQFVRSVVTDNMFSYAVQAISYIPKIFSDGPPLGAIDIHARVGIPGFIAGWWRLYHAAWNVGYLAFILWPVSVWWYIRKPSVNGAVPVILGAISLSQLVVIVFFDYYDAGQYARLSSAVQPQTYLFLFLFLWEYLFRKRDIPGRK